MAEVAQKVRVDPFVPVLVLLLFGASFFLLTTGFWERSNALLVSGGIVGMACAAFVYILLAQLYQHWRHHGYPPAIALCIAACLCSVAFAGWWLDPGSSKSPEVSERKRDLAYRARWVVISLALLVASLAFIQNKWTFWLAVLACTLVFWKYCSATLDYLGSDD